MRSFNDYTGIEGIDKLVECAPYVAEILNDREIYSNMKGKSWLELGAVTYKTHSECFDKLFEILDHKPETSISITSAVAQILVEIYGNQDLLEFFASMGKIAEQMPAEDTAE